jgi:hypothetical protein
MLASICNRIALKQDVPTVSQIMMWDRLMVPCSRVLDPVIFNSFGKSILAIWRRR